MSPDGTEEITRRWNDKYRFDDRFQEVPPRKLVQKFAHLLPVHGNALEIAGGMGGTTDFLQKHGLNVIELDISIHALLKAAAKNPSANYILADARHIPWQARQFDVVCNFYYLERSIFDFIKASVKPGGLLFFETMTVDMNEIKPEIPSERLLQPDELRSSFSGWKHIHYFEGCVDSDHGKKKWVAQLIAEKPIGSV